MNLANAPQGSPEWAYSRVGKVTASRIGAVLNFLKNGGEGAERKNYAAELICEMLTGVAAEHYVSPEMKWGIEHEEDAILRYELAKEQPTDLAGFVPHPTIERSGATPDRYAGEDGLVEAKCPKATTHIGWLLADEVPEEHIPQMLFQMACTGRVWCDFVSYRPDLPKNLQLFVKRLHWQANRIVEIEAHVQAFLAQLDGVIEELRVKFGDFELPKPRAQEEAVYEQPIEEWLEEFSGGGITP